MKNDYVLGFLESVVWYFLLYKMLKKGELKGASFKNLKSIKRERYREDQQKTKYRGSKDPETSKKVGGEDTGMSMREREQMRRGFINRKTSYRESLFLRAVCMVTGLGIQ